MARNTSVPDNAIYENNRSSNITHPSTAFSSTLSSYNVASDMDDKITDEYDDDLVGETNITTRMTDLSEETAWPYTWDIFHLGVYRT